MNWIFWKLKTCIILLCHYSCMLIYKTIVLLLWKTILRRNSAYNTRQTGHLEYRRARLDLRTRRVQYHVAELLSDVMKIFHVENISNVVFVKKLYRDAIDNFYNFDLIRICHQSQESQTVIMLLISANDDNILQNLRVVPCVTVTVVLFCILLYN